MPAADHLQHVAEGALRTFDMKDCLIVVWLKNGLEPELTPMTYTAQAAWLQYPPECRHHGGHAQLLFTLLAARATLCSPLPPTFVPVTVTTLGHLTGGEIDES